ncbi:hypothetical protein A3D85_03325 [Candidatus Amesbacteria bacterium RIFCSPHIGHO2_02_FULL_47_9]|uniref:RDD domain-containing protein n=1 Tax=Candidatus Amesbacteria bacterium RIFCSPHIGHO2_01_FULL_48_32b TaxID=1797253 RepID=A0A1F4YGV7_9BACT|nr:MAG: hypothetical protein A2876_00340 [Candidatus Amesbacteria bacterium RIFCSPHIGHO2_01_FULL_48_32b]OGD04177.1 MAG: hypothetical protein A3D85_03325 [Candidatus Amesbacteria bacterium RIFCSPHIGHO2_02_FULL_47_9]OGD07531.1 MAG: hypothetical protein A2899_04495 [Candidatus Amesbacteria bacterium RIFCSPLOWO2_01_FULL_49_25]
MKPAPIILRLTAGLIDVFIFSSLPLIFLLKLSSAFDIPSVMDALLSFVMIVIFGSFILTLLNTFLTSAIGGSIGKLITGLSVVDSSGKTIKFPRALFRNFVGYTISGVFLNAGFIWILIDPGHRAWHDLASDTWVTLTRPSRQIFGAAFALILLGLNVYLVVQIFSRVSNNISFYQEVGQDIYQETQNLIPTPTPRLTI